MEAIKKSGDASNEPYDHSAVFRVIFVRLSPTTGLEPSQISAAEPRLRFSRTLHQLGTEARVMDRLNERVQIIKNLLEGGEIIIYGPGQRVPKQGISKRVPVRRGNNASFEYIAKHGEERGVQITLQRGTLNANTLMTKRGANLAKGVEHPMCAEDQEDCFDERSSLDH